LLSQKFEPVFLHRQILSQFRCLVAWTGWAVRSGVLKATEVMPWEPDHAPKSSGLVLTFKLTTPTSSVVYKISFDSLQFTFLLFKQSSLVLMDFASIFHHFIQNMSPYILLLKFPLHDCQRWSKVLSVLL